MHTMGGGGEVGGDGTRLAPVEDVEEMETRVRMGEER